MYFQVQYFFNKTLVILPVEDLGKQSFTAVRMCMTLQHVHPMSLGSRTLAFTLFTNEATGIHGWPHNIFQEGAASILVGGKTRIFAYKLAFKPFNINFTDGFTIFQIHDYIFFKYSTLKFWYQYLVYFFFFKFWFIKIILAGRQIPGLLPPPY